jgi:RNA polymerase sigma factor (sigma-70 family)
LASCRPVRGAILGVDLDAGNRALQGALSAAAPARRGVPAAVEEDADDPETALAKKDKSTLIRECLAGLSAQHREIVDLVYYHDKSVEEVAAIVGIPENTVKTRMFYARKRLGELLKAAGIERGWP